MVNQTDLSEFQDPIDPDFFSGLVDNPRPIDHEAVVEFTDKGFITGIPVLSERQVEKLRDELGELMQPEQSSNPLFYEYHLNESTDPGTVLFHALGAWRVSPAFHDLIFLPPILNAAEVLLGGRVRLWHDQVFVKPPRDGAVVEWHQDYSYWTRTKPVAHLTCWIGLDDSTEDNGCVRYVPGSHRWDLLPRYHLSKGMSEVFNYLTDEQRSAFDPVPAILKAGEASFHHPMVLHGSYENTSAQPRRAVVVNFIRDGVYSDSDEPLLAGIPAIPRGEPVAGRFFPILGRSSGAEFSKSGVTG